MQNLAEILQRIEERAIRSSGTKSAESEGKYDCDICKDAEGYIKQTEEGEIYVRCTCTVGRKIDRLMKSSEITDAFKKHGFGNFVTEGKPKLILDAYECAKEYYQRFDAIKQTRTNSIALLGQPGCGKTHLLIAIANNLINKKHVSVLYFPFVEGFNDLRDDFDKLESKLEKMKKVDLLFVDDLFKPSGKVSNPSYWTVQQLYAVINDRHLNNRPIMISSELTPDQILDIDEALGSRIFEMCVDYMVQITGDRKTLNHRLRGV